MSNKEEQQSEKAETKQESWLKVENIDGNKDYSKIDYSKFFNLQTPIHDAIIMNKKNSFNKRFSSKIFKR